MTKEDFSSLQIGVLALQGAFVEHISFVKALGVKNVKEVRRVPDLESLDGLIIPGGESTAISKLAEQWGLLDPLRQFLKQGKVIWGTCAGMILLADQISSSTQAMDSPPVIGGLHIEVNRNHFGRQLQSFEGPVTVLDTSIFADSSVEDPMVSHGVFIRAPAVEKVLDSKSVKELATVVDKRTGKNVIVAVEQGNILGTAFHPELTKDTRWHRHFLRMVRRSEACLN